MTKEYAISLISLFLSLLTALPLFKGWVVNFSNWKTSRKVTALIKERNLLWTLKHSLSDLIVFSISTVMIVALLAGALILFNSIGFAHGFIQYSLGAGIYLFSAYRLGQLNRLKRFQKSLEKLDLEIAKLENLGKDSCRQEGKKS